MSVEAAGLPVAVILNKADLVPAQQRAQAVAEVGSRRAAMQTPQLRAFQTESSTDH